MLTGGQHVFSGLGTHPYHLEPQYLQKLVSVLRIVCIHAHMPGLGTQPRHREAKRNARQPNRVRELGVVTSDYVRLQGMFVHFCVQFILAFG